MKKGRGNAKVFGAADDDFSGDEPDGDLGKLGVTVSQEDIRALESMYLTRDGYKRSVIAKYGEGKPPLSLRKSKYIEEEEQPALGPGRLSVPVVPDKKTTEARVLERIVGKLNQEQRLNQLHTEPPND